MGPSLFWVFFCGVSCCCLLLLVAICCYLLLFVAICCYLLLSVALSFLFPVCPFRFCVALRSLLFWLLSFLISALRFLLVPCFLFILLVALCFFVFDLSLLAFAFCFWFMGRQANVSLPLFGDSELSEPEKWYWTWTKARFERFLAFPGPEVLTAPKRRLPNPQEALSRSSISIWQWVQDKKDPNKF